MSIAPMTLSVCPRCEGGGVLAHWTAEDNYDAVTCDVCRGAGAVSARCECGALATVRTPASAQCTACASLDVQPLPALRIALAILARVERRMARLALAQRRFA